MTVQELIDKLLDAPPDAVVLLLDKGLPEWDWVDLTEIEVDYVENDNTVRLRIPY